MTWRPGGFIHEIPHPGDTPLQIAVRAWNDWQALGHDPAILPKRHPASVRGVNNLLTAAFTRHGQSPGIEVYRQLRAQAAHERLRRVLANGKHRSRRKTPVLGADHQENTR